LFWAHEKNKISTFQWTDGIISEHYSW